MSTNHRVHSPTTPPAGLFSPGDSEESSGNSDNGGNDTIDDETQQQQTEEGAKLVFPGEGAVSDTVYRPHTERTTSEGTMTFGEPNSVQLDRARSACAALSRTLSRNSVLPATAVSPLQEMEEGQPGEGAKQAGGGIDLVAYLNGRVVAARELGLRRKRLGVSFCDLTVLGDVATREHIRTFWSPFYRTARSVGALFRLTHPPPPAEPFEILHNVTGVCADGEMLLVLGKPGAGCSTLLRVLANQRRTYQEVRGTVTYGGIPAEEMSVYRGEIAYNQEEDVHYPTLTVKETLDFVCKCRTPRKTVVNDPDAFVREMVDTTCAVFGLSHCQHTQVGNERIRGVSGGERKRLSIAEQFVSRASVGIWDGSTKGLDASTALDFVRALRASTDILGRTTIASFYQTSESIYALFDKVLVLDGGHCLYFGPTSTAKSYFESLGLECPSRMTTPDFLTGVTQLSERRVREGFEQRVPNTAVEFAERYRLGPEGAEAYQAIDTQQHRQQQERPDLEFREAVEQVKHKRARKQSPYMTPYVHQLRACLAREFHLMYGDRFALVTHIMVSFIKSIILGTLFYKMPLDSTGAFTRGGLIFVAILFNSLSSQAELPKSFFGRGVLYKHKALALYRPSAFYISQVIGDIPRIVLSVVLFSLVIYWMAGLHSTAGTFFTFVLVLIIVCMAMTALFRLIGAVSPNLAVANIFSGVALICFLLYAGYIIPLKSMKGWFIWIRYINPLAWGLEALLLNEFKDLAFECEPPNLLPFGAGYNDIRYQTCSMSGSRPGTNIVLGADYMHDQLSAHVSMLWPNIAITAGFWLLYVVLTAIFIEVLEFGKGGYSTNVYKARLPRPDKDKKKGGKRRMRRDHHPEDAELSRDALQLIGMQHLEEVPIFCWNRVNYTVPFKTDPGGRRQLLRGVTGWVRAGELVALMGSSGAGKTTLLDVLAQRKSVGTVSGDIRLQGRVPRSDFRLHTGYCEQLDVHNPFATVRETLRFSAMLRRPASVSMEERTAEVDRVIQLLELDGIAHAMIGHPETGRGISVEERKRVSIAMELVAKPTILFLDEPTSGLDAQASFNIIALIRRLADQGQAVVCTIHQPSAILFEHFDKLLLLARGGHTVYFGKIGLDARILISYFERNGAPKCPQAANPAEYILDAVGAGVAASSDAALDWPSIWRSSPEAEEVNAAASHYSRICEEFAASKQQQHGHARNIEKTPPAYHTSGPQQSYAVARRMMLNYWRNPAYCFGRLVNQVIVGLILGFSFYQLGYDKQALMDRSFAVFQTTVLGVLVINDVMPQFFAQRALFIRESAAGYYSWRAFTTSMLFAELPFVLLNATVFFCINYYITNYNADSSRAIYFYLTYAAFNLFSSTLGQAMAALTPSLPVAMMLAPFIASMMSNFSGVMIPAAAMPSFWRSWLYWIDPYHYIIEGLLTNDLHGVTTYCKGDQFNVLQPPPDQTCGAYMERFLKAAPGYLDNPADSADCRFCSYKVGDEFFTTLDWSFDNRWRNFGLIFAFLAINVAIIYLAMLRFRTTGQKINKIVSEEGADKAPATTAGTATEQVLEMAGPREKRLARFRTAEPHPSEPIGPQPSLLRRFASARLLTATGAYDTRSISMGQSRNVNDDYQAEQYADVNAVQESTHAASMMF